MLKLIRLFIFLFLVVSGVTDAHHLVVVRHGESDHNVQKFRNGNPNHPNYRVSNLTEEGRREVARTAKELLAKGIHADIVRVAFVSPLPRTLQTLQILIDHGVVSENVVKVTSEIIEEQYGDREGLYVWEDTYIGGETEKDIARRIDRFLAEIESQQIEEYVLVVTHGCCTAAISKQKSGVYKMQSTGSSKIY